MEFILVKILFYFSIFFILFNVFNKFQSWLFLLLGSLVFCLFMQPSSLIFLVYLIILSFLFGRIGNSNNSFFNKSIIALAIALLLIPIFLFKFILIKNLVSSNNIAFLTLLPLGISFYTFKAISYVIDIRRGQIIPESHFGRYALYISFFPQLTAGPIDRASNLLPQFSSKIEPNYTDMINGWRMILWGTFMKLVIADRLSVYVDQVFSNPYQFKGLAHLAATYFYSFQIYCDFAGYSLIAIGMAKALGISSMKNFHFPYLSENLTDFWQRWHISLSKWLRDYIFLPLAYFLSRKIKNDFLAGLKNETWAYVGGILITMTICGIWHGAQWTFVIWGLLHGLYLAVSHFSRKLKRKALKKTGLIQKRFFLRIVRIFLTFNLVTFAWIFFRANSLSDAWYIISQIFTGISFQTQQRFFAGVSTEDFLISMFFIAALFVYEYLENFQVILPIDKWGRPLRWATYYVVVLTILLFGFPQSKTFIYYNF